jgi:hypothetical protein
VYVAGRVGVGTALPEVELNVIGNGMFYGGNAHCNLVCQNVARTAGIALGYDAVDILGTIRSRTFRLRDSLTL